MFIGRKKELLYLGELDNSNRFEFSTIYARRRVGKSELIKEFIKNKDAIYYNSLETSADYNLDSLISTIYSSFNFKTVTSPASFVQVFELIYNLSKERRIVLVID